MFRSGGTLGGGGGGFDGGLGDSLGGALDGEWGGGLGTFGDSGNDELAVAWYVPEVDFAPSIVSATTHQTGNEAVTLPYRRRQRYGLAGRYVPLCK